MITAKMFADFQPTTAYVAHPPDREETNRPQESPFRRTIS
ncbi:unnamed protein product [Ixodes pacificus]